MSSAFPEITAILHDILGDDGVAFSVATRFEELPDWEATDLVSVVVEAETRFDVEFGATEISRLLTIGDLLNAIELKRDRSAAKLLPFQSVS